MLRVLPVGDLVEIYQSMAGGHLSDDLFGVKTIGTETGIPEQVHTMGLPVAGLPGGGIGSRTVTPGP